MAPLMLDKERLKAAAPHLQAILRGLSAEELGVIHGVLCHHDNFDLLALPREIRDMIYEYVFETKSGRITTRKVGGHKASFEKKLLPGLGLLRANKQVGAEASEILRRLPLNIDAALQSPKLSRCTHAFCFRKVRCTRALEVPDLMQDGIDSKPCTIVHGLIDKLVKEQGKDASIIVSMEFTARELEYRNYSSQYLLGRIYTNELSHYSAKATVDSHIFVRAKLEHLAARLRDRFAERMPKSVFNTNVDWVEGREHITTRVVDATTVRFKDTNRKRMGTLVIEPTAAVYNLCAMVFGRHVTATCEPYNPNAVI